MTEFVNQLALIARIISIIRAAEWVWDLLRNNPPEV